MQIDDFVAAATSGKTVKLSDLRGKKVLVYFYPKDDTPGCTVEGMDFSRLYAEFQALNCEIFGVSRDSLSSHEKFKCKLEMPFELLSDPDEVLCKQFDVMKLKNSYGKEVMGVERSTFLFDEAGQLLQAWRGVKSAEHAQSVLDYLKSL
jgi:peroxiredoxin Q/BCP